MPRGTFFENRGPFSLTELLGFVGIEPPQNAPLDRMFLDAASIKKASAEEITYCGEKRYFADLKTSKAGAVFIGADLLPHVPDGTVALVVPFPEYAFGQVLGAFYPDAVKSGAGLTGADFEGRQVHRSAKLESGVMISPGALIGPGAHIGANTEIGPNSVVGAKVAIGRDCLVGPNVSLVHSLIGDRVYIHAGASIGQDGFGYSLGPAGLSKIPQIGRVIIQDDVEIGANAAIDRGALEDTVIGQGSKIDNLVQIAHAVNIGLHCGIASQTGVSGSAKIGNQVLMGGQVGIIPHIKVGDGAQIAAGAGIAKHVEPGERVAGRPHRSVEQHAREWALISWLVKPENRPRSKKDLER